MIGVGFKNHKKITLEASFEDSEFEAAKAVGESLARHSKNEVLVYLYIKGKLKVKVLKKIKLVRTGFLGLKRKVVAI